MLRETEAALSLFAGAAGQIIGLLDPDTESGDQGGFVRFRQVPVF